MLYNTCNSVRQLSLVVAFLLLKEFAEKTMSDTLCCTFTINSEKGPAYWYPLIFQAVQANSFSVTGPNQPADGQVIYVYNRIGTEADPRILIGSYRSMWDEVFSEKSIVRINLWFTGENSFLIEASFNENKESHVVQTILSMNDSMMIDFPLETVKQRFSTFLSCTISLYEICKPCTGEIIWQGINIPLASFAKPLKTALLGDDERWRRKMETVQGDLSDGNHMYLAHPVLVPVKEGWTFISLAE